MKSNKSILTAISIVCVLISIIGVVAQEIPESQKESVGTTAYIKEIAPDGSSYVRCVIDQNKETCYDITMSPGYKFTECALYSNDILISGRGVEHPIDSSYSASRCKRSMLGSRVTGIMNLCMNSPGSNWKLVYQGEAIDSGTCPTGKETCLITINSKRVAYKQDTTLKECSEFFGSKSLELEPICNSMGISPSGIVGVFEVKWGTDWIVFRDLCPDELLLPDWIRDLMNKLFGFE